jgi:hypothetical protein
LRHCTRTSQAQQISFACSFRWGASAVFSVKKSSGALSQQAALRLQLLSALVGTTDEAPEIKMSA